MRFYIHLDSSYLGMSEDFIGSPISLLRRLGLTMMKKDHDARVEGVGVYAD